MDHRRDRLSDRRHPRRSRLARPGLGEVNSALPAAVSGCHKTAGPIPPARPVMFRKTREATMSCAARPLALSRSFPRPRHLVLQERNQCGRAARRGIARRAADSQGRSWLKVPSGETGWNSQRWTDAVRGV